MGDKPYRDADLRVRNGTFIGPGEWDWRGNPWSWQPNYALMLYIPPLQNFLAQWAFETVNGNLYTVHFTLSNLVIANPLVSYLEVNVSGFYSGRFNFAGTFEVTCRATLGTNVLSFQYRFPTAGDTFRLDDVSVTPEGNYVLDTLGIGVAPRPKIEFEPAVNSDYQQLVATWYDNSSCRIAYNFPP